MDGLPAKSQCRQPLCRGEAIGPVRHGTGRHTTKSRQTFGELQIMLINEQ